MNIKCVKSVCEVDHKPGMIQAFYSKEGVLKSARIRHYLGIEAGKPKFSYCNQSLVYAESQLRLAQKPLIESVACKAIAIGENHNLTNGQVSGQTETSSNARTESGCSLAWFRTSACHVDDPGSNPGNRTNKWVPRPCIGGEFAPYPRLIGMLKASHPRAKCRFLLEDQEIRRWVENIVRGSLEATEIHIRNLGNFCQLMNTRPAECGDAGKT